MVIGIASNRRSKIENKEAVTSLRPLRERSRILRNAFVAAHSAYTVAFKNTGDSLSSYVVSEANLTSASFAALATSFSHHHPAALSSSSSSIASSSTAPLPPIVQPPIDTPSPALSLLPDFQLAPLQLTASMLDLPPTKHLFKIPTNSTIQEDNDDDNDDDDEGEDDESHDLDHRRHDDGAKKNFELAGGATGEGGRAVATFLGGWGGSGSRGWGTD